MPDIVCCKNLRLLPLFSDMEDEEYNSIEKVLIFKCYEKGSPLFMQGDRLTHFHILFRGAVQLFRVTPDGHELTSDILNRGDLICVSCNLAPGQFHQENARAVSDTEVLLLPLAWVREHLRQFDHLALRLLAIMSAKLDRARVDFERQASMGAKALIACFLQRLCEIYGFDPRGFELPYSKTLIASRLGIELETFSRALPKLKDYGIIVCGNFITFSDTQAAQRLSCGNCPAETDCTARKHMQAMAKQKVRVLVPA